MEMDYTQARAYCRALGGTPPKKLDEEWLERVAALEEYEARYSLRTKERHAVAA